MQSMLTGRQLGLEPSVRRFDPYLCIQQGVAQLGSALDSDSRGRWFDSSRPDHAGVVELVYTSGLDPELRQCRFEPCLPYQLGVAQFGRALALEVRGRSFKSNHLDQTIIAPVAGRGRYTNTPAIAQYPNW